MFNTYIYIYVYMYVYMYIYIYIYVLYCFSTGGFFLLVRESSVPIRHGHDARMYRLGCRNSPPRLFASHSTSSLIRIAQQRRGAD